MERGGRTRGMVLTVLLTAALICLLAAAAAGPAAAFTDVDPGDWYAPAVTGLVDAGVVAGFGDGSFRPGESVTRAQFAAMLFRALKLPDRGRTNPSSTWPTATGATKPSPRSMPPTWSAGVTPDLFAPDERVSRQQAATLLSRGLAYSLRGGSTLQPEELAIPADQVPSWLAAFRDRGAIAEAHAEGVAIAYRAGVVDGYDDGRFFPTRTLNRAQAAVMLAPGALLAAVAALPTARPRAARVVVSHAQPTGRRAIWSCSPRRCWPGSRTGRVPWMGPTTTGPRLPSWPSRRSKACLGPACWAPPLGTPC